ncbi:MAG: EfeM/EfeO family lipoprotein [Actinomycetota bacterium]|nr:EfeM/EfeO family lipoprotein [Actinomycetota bacterium]
MKRGILLAAALLALAMMINGCGQPPTSSDDTTGKKNKTSSGETTEATGGETTGESTTADIADSPKLAKGTERYEKYVVRETDSLVQRTRAFTDAVEAGNVEEAKRLYAPARVPWERIEPIAATLGDYDPDIDAREGDVPDDEWSGFHRIEEALWERDTTEGQEEYARQLMEDVEGVRDEVKELELEPVDLVAGSVELLNEVSAGKITGEEERYSHTDLYDIQANIQGSEAAFEELEPALEEADPTLVGNVEQRFDSVYAELEPYREGDGWVPYTELDEEERRELSQKVDALAEPLSQIGQVLGS